MTARPLILIVDDNPGDVDLIQLALEESALPIDVASACDGKDARRVMEAMTIADLARLRVILLDLNMPRMNGREFLTWLRSQPCYARIVVVVLTSSTVPTERKECLDLGAADFWTKEPKFDSLTRQMAGVGRYL